MKNYGQNTGTIAKILKDVLRHQRLIRRLDEIHLLDGSGRILMSDVRNITLEFVPPLDKAYELLVNIYSDNDY